MNVEQFRKRHYSDPKYDGTSAFYAWLRQHARADSRVLNYGAGPATQNRIRTLKGEVAEIVGADVHPVVFENPELDRAVLIENGVVPLDSGSFDIIYSDYVLEHVEKPLEFLGEVARLLKPGGSYFFRTPNSFHYTALVSAATPHWFHEKVAKAARALADDAQEPWPTYYRMNTTSSLREYASKCGFDSVEFRMVEAEPSYLMFHPIAAYLGLAYERLINSTEALAGLRANIFGKFSK